jgi:hypothetical protein
MSSLFAFHLTRLFAFISHVYLLSSHIWTFSSTLAFSLSFYHSVTILNQKKVHSCTSLERHSTYLKQAVI